MCWPFHSAHVQGGYAGVLLGFDFSGPTVLQVCKAGVARMRKIWFTRHGESEYNRFAKIGGNSGLSIRGEAYARILPDLLVDRVPLVSMSVGFSFRADG